MEQCVIRKVRKVFFVFVFLAIGVNTLLNAEEPEYDNVTKLYVATFNRAPDAGGLDYWLNDSGLDLEEIAQSFFDQNETQATYPITSTSTDFVKAVYENLFNRAAETAGIAYWVAELDSGRIAKSTFILAVINGAQDTVEYGNDDTILNHKTIVGLAFANAGLDDVTLATEIMEGITDDFTTVELALENIDLVLEIDNFAPVANAGTDQNVNTTSTVTLNGNASFDADSNTLTYSWIFISKPPGSSATLSNTTIVNPTFLADEDGSYIVQLIVNDGIVDSLADTVTIISSNIDSIDTVSFMNDIMPIFVANCKSCHTSTSKRIFKVGDAAYTYANIITNNLISTTLPDTSSLLIKGNGEDSHNGGDQFSDLNSNIVRDWIEEGGLNN